MKNKVGTYVIVGLILCALITVVTASEKFQIEGSSGIVSWLNSTGSLNITEDFICPACINPEDVNDIDKEDIETDLNTFVDIAGDTMTGNLGMGDKNITDVTMINMTGGLCMISNTTHMVWESC